jgi:WD40 repeat protein
MTMFSTSQVEYHFNHPCRCICSAKSASNSNGFLSNNEVGDHPNNMSFFVGSCWLPNKGSNVINRMKYDDDLCELLLDASFTHSSLGDIHQISACPLNNSLSLQHNRILTTHRSTSTETKDSLMMDTVVWQLPPSSNLGPNVDDEDDALIDSQVLEELINFSNLQGRSNEPNYTVSSAAWHSHTENQIITSNYSGEIKLWDLHTQQTHGEWNINESNWRNDTSRRIVCDPHDPNRIAIPNGCDIVFLDTRTAATPAMVLRACHRYGVTDFDANPNRPFVYATAGQDSFIKFHDVRQIVTSSHGSSSPLLKMIKGGHTHWVSTIRFNPYHDQLLVSTGTDSAVNLWRISSISSAPILEVSEEAPYSGSRLGGSGTTDDEEYFTLSRSHDSASAPNVDATAPDINVQKYEHQESVYGMTWIDPWCYVSLSYDGHVVLHHVPSREKYKILL